MYNISVVFATLFAGVVILYTELLDGSLLAGKQLGSLQQET